MKAETILQKNLTRNKFAVSCECTPPRGTDLDTIYKLADRLKGKVDAINVNDNPSSNVKMSSFALSKILLDMGIEPILEMTTRDRNRIALQSDLLGASAMGIKNILCLTGDHPSKGDHPEANKVFDIDSSQWIAAVKRLRDQGCLMSGKSITGNPEFFIGGVANPFVKNIELHILRLRNKIAAGAEFILTQPVLDMDHFKRWLNQAEEQGLTEQVPIMAGVVALESARMARYLHNNVSGFMVPDPILEHLDALPENKQQDEGLRICIEKIEELKQMKGVKGVHIMAIGCEEKLSEIIERAGLLPRPE